MGITELLVVEAVNVLRQQSEVEGKRKEITYGLKQGEIRLVFRGKMAKNLQAREKFPFPRKCFLLQFSFPPLGDYSLAT